LPLGISKEKQSDETFFVCFLTLGLAVLGWAIPQSDSDAYKENKSDFVIFLPPKATAPEHTAAELLQRYLMQITGTKFLIRVESAKNQRRGIFIGNTAVSASVRNGEPLIPDEIFIVSSQERVILCGGGTRGTLYAAHAFLERLGVRWWARNVGTVPEWKPFTAPVWNCRQKPAFPLVRWCIGKDTGSSIRFNVACRNNMWGTLPDSWGGRYQIIGFCHTFSQLIPPAEFEKRPEWFWLRKGVRQGKKEEGKIYTHQLCLSNGEVRKEIAKRVLAWADKNPAADAVSVSPNDSWPKELGCECAECQKLNQQYGSPAGPLIILLNETAELLSAKHPEMMLDTLAYRYTRKPPTGLKLHPNVQICVCDIECDFSKPLTHPDNADFVADLKGWLALTPNVRVWHYTSNFTNPFIPHPALLNAAEDLRFLRKCGVKGILFENHQSPIGEFGDLATLRTYIVPKLMWDPSLDQEALIQEFLKEYYGAAAPYLREYIALTADAVARSGVKLGCFRVTSDDWLKPDTMVAAWKTLDQAEKAVASDPVLLERVKVFRHPLTVAVLGRDDPEMQKTLSLPPREALAASAIALAQKHGMSGKFVARLQKLLTKK